MSNISCVLLYNMKDPVISKKIKFVLIRMGVRIKNIEIKDYLQPIGAMAGIAGIEKNDKIYEGPELDEPMMVMYGFMERQLDDMLARFRKEKIPRVNLKAVVTASNREWDAVSLYEELKREHEKMSGEMR